MHTPEPCLPCFLVVSNFSLVVAKATCFTWKGKRSPALRQIIKPKIFEAQVGSAAGNGGGGQAVDQGIRGLWHRGDVEPR